jgi:hypothetical protein
MYLILIQEVNLFFDEKAGDLAAPYTNVRDSTITVFSPSITKEIQHKLAVCIGTHPSCPGRKFSYLPTRVVDVLSMADKGMVFIHVASPSEIAPYAALSYVWGSSQ